MKRTTRRPRYSLVRLDGGDSQTPHKDRRYAKIAIGYGEKTRAENARRKYAKAKAETDR